MRIPYGIADFATIRKEGFYYADKTPFLPQLERAESGYRYLMFLRPRRFGKSTLVSMLAHYYDIDCADRFDESFRGLWIHENPTPERNKYLVLKFDFSAVVTESSSSAVRESFAREVRSAVAHFIDRYISRLPDLQRLRSVLESGAEDSAALMTELFRIVQVSGQNMYLLLDEYDHFANRLLAEGQQDVYKSVVTGTGFVRSFYAALKIGTGMGVVSRIFMTGVTPLMLDDMTSGFNISTNISMHRRFNALAGFTHADVERALEEFVSVRPHLRGPMADRAKLFELLESYYDGYRFSAEATERMFNSDMVLYFLREIDQEGKFPRELLDRNVRTAYDHLQRIGAAGGHARRERYELLESILEKNSIRSDIIEQFGVKNLPVQSSFISLLYYTGMLTFRDAPLVGMAYDLEIPNRVIRALQWEYLESALREQERFAIDTAEIEFALADLAVRGDIRPLLEAFDDQILQHISIKDTQNLDEKTIKLLLMMFVSLGRVFYALSEKEFSQGYCDLFLSAAPNVPGLHYSWLLELKYLKSTAKEAQIENAFAEAAQQVERYSKDPKLLPLLVGDYQLRCGRIVFVGTKRILFRAWPDDLSEERVEVVAKPAKKSAAKKKTAAKKAAPKKKTVKTVPAPARKRSPRR